jgi:hypothetical protein
LQSFENENLEGHIDTLHAAAKFIAESSSINEPAMALNLITSLYGIENDLRTLFAEKEGGEA